MADRSPPSVHGCTTNLVRQQVTKLTASSDALHQLKEERKSPLVNIWKSAHELNANIERESSPSEASDNKEVLGDDDVDTYIDDEDRDGDLSCDLLVRGIRRLSFHNAVRSSRICDQGPVLRTRFIVERWMPFIEELNTLRGLAEQRVHAGYQIGSRFPVHGHDLPTLAQMNFTITEEWYGVGHGNICAVYRWFINVSELIGVSAYNYTSIPVSKSADDTCTIVDGKTRVLRQKKVSNRDSDLVKFGGVSQKQGVSAIDNTVLCNTLPPLQAKVIIAGSFIKRWLIKFLRKRQKRILFVLGRELRISKFRRMDPSVVASVLGCLSREDLIRWSINSDNLSYRCLASNGFLLKDWGQLNNVDRACVHSYIQSSVERYWELENAERDKTFHDTCRKFIKHNRDCPGNWYEDDQQLHLRILLIGLWCGAIAVIKRTEMEKLTIAKYIPLEWRRRVDLLTVTESGQTKKMREAGAIEYSRIRINEFPYAPSHGMSLAGGEHLEGKKRVGMLHQLSLPCDPTSRLENWYLIDIEKILQECKVMNPNPRGATKLPNEDYHAVGQNPKIGSSVARTQHTQVWRATVQDYNVYTRVNRPHYYPAINAHVDVIQVGSKADGSFIKFTVDDVCDYNFVVAITDLRMKMLKSFGGPHRVDLNVVAMHDGNKSYVVTVCVLSQLEEFVSPETGLKLTRNPDTGKTSVDFDLRSGYDRIDTQKSGGNFQVYTTMAFDTAVKEGKAILSRLYDYTCKPGCAKVIEDWLVELDAGQQ